MTAATLGTHGIPLIGFGTYPLKGGEAERCVAMALDLGYRHIDTAQMYGNEGEVGRAIRASGIAREEIFLVTKVDPSNLGAQRFAGSVTRSVDALGTVPDVLLIHWPPADEALDATVERLVAEQDKGNARLIGVSNFTPAMLRRAQAIAAGRIICNQVEFHPLLDQSALLGTARELGVALTAYRPLARGKAMAPAVIQQIAKRHGRPASEIVLRWIIQQGIPAIPMTTQRANAQSNLNALSFSLPEEDMAAISAIRTRDGRTINPSWMSGRWD
jgi:diketogulonate reductase-like aldo/keto reductase